MNITLIAQIVLVAAVLVWFGYRQTTWRPIRTDRVWLTPLVLIGAGLLQFVSQSDPVTLTGAQLGVMVIELAIGAGVGALIGRIATIRPVTEATLAAHEAGRHAGRPAPAYEVRNGVLGLVLWIVFIAARVGLGVWAASMGANVLGTVGLVLVLLGVNRLARTAVITLRAPRALALAA